MAIEKKTEFPSGNKVSSYINVTHTHLKKMVLWTIALAQNTFFLEQVTGPINLIF